MASAASLLDAITDILGCFPGGKLLHPITLPKLERKYLKVCIAAVQSFRFKRLLLKCLVKIFSGSLVFQATSI